MEIVFGLIFILLALLFYLLPSLIAYWRNHPSVAGIFALNLLLGWTLIGWVVSLAWALAVSDGGTCWRCNARLNGFPLVCHCCQAELGWVGDGSGKSRPRKSSPATAITAKPGGWKP